MFEKKSSFLPIYETSYQEDKKQIVKKLLGPTSYADWYSRLASFLIGWGHGRKA